jgi:hypothetical protein
MLVQQAGRLPDVVPLWLCCWFVKRALHWSLGGALVFVMATTTADSVVYYVAEKGSATRPLDVRQRSKLSRTQRDQSSPQHEAQSRTNTYSGIVTPISHGTAVPPRAVQLMRDAGFFWG